MDTGQFQMVKDLSDPEIDPVNWMARTLAQILTELQGLRADVQELTRTTFNVNAPGFWPEKK